MLKQVIIIRKDLNMRKGKMVAQGSHASLGAYLDSPNTVALLWLENGQTKICVSVDSEEELIEIHKKAKVAGLPNVLIRDAGHTEFKEPTLTAVGIGPCEAELVDPITGSLKLL